MNLKNYKEQAKIVGATALSFIPIYNVGKYFYNIYQTKKMYNSNQAELERINSIIDSLPKSQKDVASFRENADPEIVRMYNQNYADALENGQNDDAGFDLENLHEQAINGVPGAKEAFNNAFANWQNRFYLQAADSTEAQILEQYANFDVGSVDLSLLDIISATEVSQTLIAFASGLVAWLFLNYVYGKTIGANRKALKRAKKAEIKQEKNMKEERNYSKKEIDIKNNAEAQNDKKIDDEFVVIEDGIIFKKDEGSLNITKISQSDKENSKDSGEDLILF